MSLLVSIHDVSPAHANGVKTLWRMCEDHGIQPTLLVVPNWHGRWPLDAHLEFCSWLRARQGDGAEIFLHGERHDEHALPRSPLDHVRAAGRTEREGEFLTLDADDAARRIQRGLRTLRSLGLSPTGFVPPAWLATRECWRAVAALGLRFFEDAREVVVTAAPRRVRAPVVRWSARSAWRAWASVSMAEYQWRSSHEAAVVRIALHPQDLEHPAMTVSVSRTLERWRTARTPMAYREL